ncbi:MAG TPA: lysophospholipid acyltransferase family protein [Ferruginibacter sp.]|nr:lysophospholipid acyltransferase family protein [Ferruginibacter sp.]
MYYVIYGFLYLISLLPFTVLYLISDLIYFFLYHVFGYRKKIVMGNLRIAFPGKPDDELTRIAKRTYRNLTDTFVEIIKTISMSDRSFEKRCRGDFSMISDLIKKGKNIQLHAGHQFNWEWGSLFMSKSITDIPSFAIYMPIKNKAMERLFLKIRQRYGTKFIKAPEFREKREEIFGKRFVFFLAADQNPGNPSSAYWQYFFSKPAPFITGPEVGGIKNDTAIVFVRSRIVKRGHYVLECKLCTENGASTCLGEITGAYRDFLEEVICEEPHNYLWTHRRWKWEYKEEYKDQWIDHATRA